MQSVLQMVKRCNKAKVNLTLREVAILLALTTGPTLARTLCERVDIPGPSCTRATQMLRRHGLIKSERNPTKKDGRDQLHSITPRGVYILTGVNVTEQNR